MKMVEVGVGRKPETALRLRELLDAEDARSPDYLAKVDETMSFFRFSYKGPDRRTPKDRTYRGRVYFEIHGPEIPTQKVVVDVDPDRSNAVEIWSNPTPEDMQKCSCRVKADCKTFLRVYSGEIPPHKAILSGKISVYNWAYTELRSFCAAFDFRSETWTEFYRHKDLESMLETQRRSELNVKEDTSELKSEALTEEDEAFVSQISSKSDSFQFLPSLGMSGMRPTLSGFQYSPLVCFHGPLRFSRIFQATRKMPKSYLQYSFLQHHYLNDDRIERLSAQAVEAERRLFELEEKSSEIIYKKTSVDTSSGWPSLTGLFSSSLGSLGTYIRSDFSFERSDFGI